MLIVGIGGTLRPRSGSELALRVALGAAAAAGFKTRCFSGEALRLPLYEPGVVERDMPTASLVSSLRKACGVIVCSPGYHGTVSGVIKNALDYVEDLSRDSRVYLDGIPVGCISMAQGWPAAVATIDTLRSVTHALRGWPTPYACPVRARAGLFDDSGACINAEVREQLERVGSQVAQFASRCDEVDYRQATA